MGLNKNLEMKKEISEQLEDVFAHDALVINRGIFKEVYRGRPKTIVYVFEITYQGKTMKIFKSYRQINNL